MVQIEQMAAEQVVSIATAFDEFSRLIFGIIPPAANFQSCNNRNRLRLSYSPKITKLTDGSLGQLVQIVIIMMQDAFAQLNCRFVVVAGAYQYSDQFSIG